jgi:hypothetical protein
MRTFGYLGFSGDRAVAVSAAGRHTHRLDLVVSLRIRLTVGDNGHDGATSAATKANAQTELILGLRVMQHPISLRTCRWRERLGAT